MAKLYYESLLSHYGVQKMKWGVRRYQNPDGSLTLLGEHRYVHINASDLLDGPGRVPFVKGQRVSIDELLKVIPDTPKPETETETETEVKPEANSIQSSEPAKKIYNSVKHKKINSKEVNDTYNKMVKYYMNLMKNKIRSQRSKSSVVHRPGRR